MARQLHKKYCQRCNRSYLTYEENLLFCNSDCEHKYTYEKIRGFDPNLTKKQNICACCGDECTAKFCNTLCRNTFLRKKTTKNSQETFKADKKKNCHKLPYDVLNKIAEKKRIFEDSWWNYNTNHNRI